MTTKHITLKEVFEEAFYQGFISSGEGYNGEYPFGDKNLNLKECNSYKLDLAMAYGEYVEKLKEIDNQ